MGRGLGPRTRALRCRPGLGPGSARKRGGRAVRLARRTSRTRGSRGQRRSPDAATGRTARRHGHAPTLRSCGGGRRGRVPRRPRHHHLLVQQPAPRVESGIGRRAGRAADGSAFALPGVDRARPAAGSHRAVARLLGSPAERRGDGRLGAALVSRIGDWRAGLPPDDEHCPGLGSSRLRSRVGPEPRIVSRSNAGRRTVGGGECVVGFPPRSPLAVPRTPCGPRADRSGGVRAPVDWTAPRLAKTEPIGVDREPSHRCHRRPAPRRAGTLLGGASTGRLRGARPHPNRVVDAGALRDACLARGLCVDEPAAGRAGRPGGDHLFAVAGSAPRGNGPGRPRYARPRRSVPPRAARGRVCAGTHRHRLRILPAGSRGAGSRGFPQVLARPHGPDPPLRRGRARGPEPRRGQPLDPRSAHRAGVVGVSFRPNRLAPPRGRRVAHADDPGGAVRSVRHPRARRSHAHPRHRRGLRGALGRPVSHDVAPQLAGRATVYRVRDARAAVALDVPLARERGARRPASTDRAALCAGGGQPAAGRARSTRRSAGTDRSHRRHRRSRAGGRSARRGSAAERCRLSHLVTDRALHPAIDLERRAVQRPGNARQPLRAQAARQPPALDRSIV